MAKRLQQTEGWRQHVDHHHAWVAIFGVIIIAAVALYAGFSHASGDRYSFTARGVITQVNDDKSLDITVSEVSAKGVDDLKGVNQTFRTVTSSKYYKVVSGKDKRVTVNSLTAGQEVSFKGVAKDDDAYIVTWLRINDRSFSVIGTLKDVNRTNKTYTVAVKTSTYKPSTYNNKDVVMNYGGNTVFTSQGSPREADDVTSGEQRVKVTGKITDFGKWEIERLYDNYTGK